MENAAGEGGEHEKSGLDAVNPGPENAVQVGAKSGKKIGQ
jgi:hypothetical protein